MTTTKPEPASDEFVANFKVATEREIDKFGEGYRTTIDLKLISRIESDRARIREQAEENERLRSALINLRAKCLEMGWEPRSPQLLDAAAALFSKPEPKE